LVARLALGRAHPVPRIFQVPGPLHLEHGLVRALDLATSGVRDYWIGSCRWTCEEYARRGVGAERLFLSYYGMAGISGVAGIAGAAPGGEPAPARGAFRRALDIEPDAPLVGMVAYT